MWELLEEAQIKPHQIRYWLTDEVTRKLATLLSYIALWSGNKENAQYVSMK